MKLLICAGGTGGHIFPGIAVAETLRSADEKHEILFVGTRQGLEGRLIPRAGFRLVYVEARQFLGRSLIYKALTLFLLARGVATAAGILRREKPDAILGMGGFTTVPVILAGMLMRIPSFLHEQNVQPGMANGFLARITKKTFISFEETRSYLITKKILHTGNPIRKILSKGDTAHKQKGPFGIFVFGGSRGAKSINDAVIELLPYLTGLTDVSVYHQTGQEDFDRVRKAYEGISIPHEVFPFTDEMDKYYALSDVVISRAGATTIFELAAFKKAAILIPYPYSAGGHQWKNAAEIERLGGAYLIANEEATGVRLFKAIKHLRDEPELLGEMGRKINSIFVPDAAERIIGGIVHGLS